MNNCYRVEVNCRSKYFENEDEAVMYYVSKLKLNNDVELWHVSYRYSESLGIYIATQTLLDYYSVHKVGV